MSVFNFFIEFSMDRIHAVIYYVGLFWLISFPLKKILKWMVTIGLHQIHFKKFDNTITRIQSENFDDPYKCIILRIEGDFIRIRVRIQNIHKILDRIYVLKINEFEIWDLMKIFWSYLRACLGYFINGSAGNLRQVTLSKNAQIAIRRLIQNGLIVTE